MYETKITISIKTKKELTEEEVVHAMVDFKWRLEGYHTDPLEFLANTIIEISKKYSQSKLKDLPI